MKLAVIGDPISHSLSPLMHNAALRTLGIDGEYMARHVTREQLPEFVGFARCELDGFNITVPHKNAIIPFLDEVDPAALLAGSVNTVSVRSGRLYGESTDGYGLETAIRDAFGVTIPGNRFVFLGCGGAAHAAAFHFASRGAQEIRFINRTVAKAQETADAVKKAFSGLKTDVLPLEDSEKITDFLSGAAVLVQCTSVGLRDDDPSPLDPNLLPPDIRLYDTIYKKTALQKEAEKRGIPCAGGLAMLLHQGARSLEIWTGCKAPVEAMRAALLRA